MSHGISYTVSSVSAIVEEPFSVTLNLGTASAEECVAPDLFAAIIQVVIARMSDLMAYYSMCGVTSPFNP